jgi:ATP-binding cassette subfamily C protein
MKLERDCIKNGELSEVGKKDRFDVDVEVKKEISLEHVSFTYTDEHHFKIIDLNLMIPAGKITAIVGQSGAGKSTIADLVMGLIKPDNGKITLDGNPLKSNVSWKNRIGYVAQDTFLFNESVRFNLLLARSKADEKDLTDVLKMAAAYQFVSKLPDGMDTLIGDRGVHLSGGERQRLALARALLRRPSLLILDEATSNLDSENEARILNAIENLHGDMTILMIAHRLSTIRNADYIYLIEDGMVRESGTWDSLIKKEKGKFRRLYEIQS